MALPNDPRTGKPFASVDAMQEYMTSLEQQLAAKNNRAITFGIGEENGTVCVYGINTRMPVSLYAGQWPRLIEAATGKPLADDSPLAQFIAKHKNLLALRDATGKDEPADVQKNKAILRKADTSGVVRHPKNVATK